MVGRLEGRNPISLCHCTYERRPWHSALLSKSL
jgi:hypothetical protein